ncbi:MAG TPA: alkaline phosphatase family protein [Kofleriaceae bacterium]|nr:alkaline phosphatase family protein [Kofleriaceae bacterium]
MLLLTTCMIACTGDDPPVAGDGLAVTAQVKPGLNDLQKVKHVIVVLMENHSFDNYLGVLPYVSGGPYHAPTSSAGCQGDDHACVDGLTCRVDASGALQCSNSNRDDDGSSVVAFHNSNRCVQPDVEHGWVGTHREVNFAAPNATRSQQPMDGFVRVNNAIQPSNDDQTMGYYNQSELPFYYDLAQHFAISDRFFSSLLGPTFPNRAYFAAATSFGHLTTSDQIPPLDGYKPIHGTIFDLLDRNNVSWADYYTDIPQGASFRPFGSTIIDPHFLPMAVFLAKAAGVPAAGDLPSVSFVDPGFGPVSNATATDEHPPTDIQRGQAFVSAVVNAVRSGPFWKDSVIFITYDEHGGFYDHVAPPRAIPPDDIQPGQCADLSNPPASLQPGGGAECSDNLHGDPDTSVVVATQLCPALASNPTGPYPDGCAKFDQLGVRVPFIAVSPFSRPQYVSHTTADLTSILSFIETRFTPHQHLTERDHHANNLLELFDFANAPSLATPVGFAAPPLVDCTPPG